MSLATHVGRGRVPIHTLRAPTVQLITVALGVATVIGVAAHGHDPSVLAAELSIHTTFETGLMAAGMMLPVAALGVPLVMQRSLRARRLRASAEHVLGFALVWFGFGVIVAALIGLVTTERMLLPLFVLGAAAAAAWQLSDRRSIIVRRCGRLRSSPPRGWRADLGVVIAGGDQATWCLRTCAPIMATMILAPHPVVMGLLWAANLSEWAPGPNPFGRTRATRPAALLVVVAASSLGFAAL